MAEFTTSPSYVYVEEIGYRTQIIKMEDGGEVRNSRGTARRTFTLNFDRVTSATRTEIFDFFTARTGQLSTFDWLNPNDSVTYTVRFVSGSLESKEVDYQMYDITCNFIEVI